MKARTTCRVCEGALELVLSLGDLFVSDFPSPDQRDGARGPLDLALCRDCKLLQLMHTIPAETMYRNYWYRSGTNQSMRDALADITHKAERLIHLKPGDAVLDVGCNDGTLLGSYRTHGIIRVGFDPAQNLSTYSRATADTVVTTFFGAAAYAQEPSLRGVRPRVVTSIAMFYDLEDPNSFVADIKQVMAPEGLWIVQMSYLPLMLKQNAFDNICHEHLEYYSYGSMEALLERHGMRVVDVELNDVNGGSIRLYIRNDDADERQFADDTQRALAADRIAALADDETAMALESKSTYEDFALRVARIKSDVVDYVRRQTGAGKKVFVYGASTKGNTLLQYFGLDHTIIEAAAERNPDKWGKVTAGTRIPIISEQEARARRPEYFLVLPWHFIEEFQARERAYLRDGGRFIVPMPHFTLL
jgi:NDP-4-keto-2,6-dideoxyhexose 3-C-methyltransferase